jgi:hypothetical protein
MCLLFVTNVSQNSLGCRVVRGQVVGFIEIDGFQLTGYIQPDGLHQLCIAQFPFNISLKGVCKIWHVFPPLVCFIVFDYNNDNNYYFCFYNSIRQDELQGLFFKDFAEI